MAVFSLAAGIFFFDFAKFESFSFFGLSIFYCASSLVVAHYFFRNYREIAQPIRVIRVYLVPYLVLALWTLGSTFFLVWILPSLVALIYSFLFINYYIFFVIVIGFVISRFRVVSRFFEIYNFYILGKAKKLAKKYAFTVDVDEYVVGSDPKTDGMLDDIWAHKAYPVPYVRRLETAICENHVVDINRMLARMRECADPKEKAMSESLGMLKEDYLRRIMEIEKKVD